MRLYVRHFGYRLARNIYFLSSNNTIEHLYYFTSLTVYLSTSMGGLSDGTIFHGKDNVNQPLVSPNTVCLTLVWMRADPHHRSLGSARKDKA